MLSFLALAAFSLAAPDPAPLPAPPGGGDLATLLSRLRELPPDRERREIEEALSQALEELANQRRYADLERAGRAILDASSVVGPSCVDLARAFRGMALFRLGRFAESEDELRPLCERADEAASASASIALEFFGRALAARATETGEGRGAALLEADRSFERMAALARTMDDPGREMIAWSRRLSVAQALPDPDREALALDAIVELARAEARIPDAIKRWALVNAGKAHRDRFEHLRSIAALELAAPLDMTPEHRAEIHALICEAAWTSGRYDRARIALHKLLGVLAAAGRPDGPRMAKLTVDAADCARRLGLPERALELLDLVAERDLPHSAWRLHFWNTRALLRERYMDDEGVIDDTGRGLAIEIDPADDGGQRIAAALHINRGRALLRLDTLAAVREAEAHYDAARRIAESRGMAGITAAGLDGLARARIRSGDPEGAIELVDRALAIERTHGLADYELFTMVTAARAHMTAGDLERARTMLDDGLSRLAQAVRPEHRSRFSQASELRQDLTFAEHERAREEEKGAIARAGLLASGDDKDRVVFESLAARNGGEPRRGEGSFGSLCAALEGGRAFIEYATGEADLYAYVVDGGEASMHHLGPRREIESRCREFRRLVLELRGNDPREIEPAGHALHETLLGPLADRGVDPSRPLVVAPTAEIAAVPFDALVTERGDAALKRFQDVAFLIRSRLVTLVPSGRILALLHERPPRSAPGAALVLGDARFQDDGGGGARTTSLGDLAGTRDECVGVADYLVPPDDQGGAEARTEIGAASSPRRRDASVTGNGFVDLHLGAFACPDRFEGDLGRYAVIHIATHGLVDPYDPRNTRLLLSRSPGGDADLDLEEIRALRLDADLVVLSACSSGRGPILRGEGVQSLAGAFLRAGARSVIASLCDVDDLVTRDLMVDFYERTAENKGVADPSPGRTAERLRQARLRLLQDPSDRGLRPEGSEQAVHVRGGHPYLWAAFSYIGSVR